mmetsp:Transcript_101733/g.313961  ORF Transcript_101733/g.313961 Transcript_101733/m.313961 type:complete len:370 (-) Transcript_101733:498-1607(-)
MVAPSSKRSKMQMMNSKVLLIQSVPIAPEGSFSTPPGLCIPAAFSAARKACSVARPAGSAAYQVRVFLMLFPKSMRPIFIAGPMASRMRMKASPVSSSCGTLISSASARVRNPVKTGSRLGNPATSSGPSCLQSWSPKILGMLRSGSWVAMGRSGSSRAAPASSGGRLPPWSCSPRDASHNTKAERRTTAHQDGSSSGITRGVPSKYDAKSTEVKKRTAVLQELQSCCSRASQETQRDSAATLAGGTRTSSSTGSLQAPGCPEAAQTRQALPAPTATRCDAWVDAPAEKAKFKDTTSLAASAASAWLSSGAAARPSTRRSTTETWRAVAPLLRHCSASTRTSTSISPVEPSGRTLRPAKASPGRLTSSG